MSKKLNNFNNLWFALFDCFRRLLSFLTSQRLLPKQECFYPSLSFTLFYPSLSFISLSFTLSFSLLLPLFFTFFYPPPLSFISLSFIPLSLSFLSLFHPLFFSPPPSLFHLLLPSSSPFLSYF
jgi:hypothetical protein